MLPNPCGLLIIYYDASRYHTGSQRALAAVRLPSTANDLVPEKMNRPMKCQCRKRCNYVWFDPEWPKLAR